MDSEKRKVNIFLVHYLRSFCKWLGCIENTSTKKNRCAFRTSKPIKNVHMKIIYSPSEEQTLKKNFRVINTAISAFALWWKSDAKNQLKKWFKNFKSSRSHYFYYYARQRNVEWKWYNFFCVANFFAFCIASHRMDLQKKNNIFYNLFFSSLRTFPLNFSFCYFFTIFIKSEFQFESSCCN